jgi:fibronectin-binding autotransporter adhesin
VTRAGPGTLILTGTNTYTGGTTVTTGTLEFASPAALPSVGIINISRPGAVNLLGLLAESPPVADVSTDPTSFGVLSGDTCAGLRIANQTATSSTGGSSLPDMGSLGAGVTAASVPEPSTLALLGVAAVGLIGWTWWRKGT